MKEFIKYALFVLNITSLIIGIPVVAFILYCEFLGYDKGNEFLNKISFPLNDNGIILIGIACAIIMVASWFIRKKYFN